ncbi:MAG TPA: 3-dehydroquinate synthase [Nitrospirae bacterium]|nr:3-dehydroquinate synthase [bacterium BMS3Abin09]GBE41534.1 3-dehydroquinate synthase [bacterium BMS3Bbin09]HDH34582.1 3-dehydroquinate synthase [Nitrospirota bacterium]HDN94961.1 3-dehydroquinate synthase [Nitrospirota bacterium]HDO67424.1 3-dehydroquinate synthase [Nitrospirota bacterium]
MKIVLTGFMGTGKTSVGKEISRKLGYRFIDTDVLIEKREGRAISVIFKENGEDYFRKLEEAVIEVVSKEMNVVIATGGGVIKNRKNVKNLRREGIIIWLKASPEIILKRIMTEGGKRPLLEVEEPLNEVNKLLNERMGLYKQGDTSFDTDYITSEEAAEEIIEKLGLDSETVSVSLGERSYEIIIGSKTIQKLGLRIKELRPSKVAVISNETIFPLYKDALLDSLREYDIVPEVFLIPDGEEYKDSRWVNHLHGELLKARVDRSSVLIALGGGVVGDITGFVASTYMRGIRFVQVPTTLLAQVDSSVGGKTGVNHPLGKNMIGTFYQPSLVMIDIDTLKTLPQREFCAGMAEVIKYGVIADKNFFDFLVKNRDNIVSHGDSIVHIIKRSCEIKADVVSKDEREAGLRAILNFGHTVGHAVETVTEYKQYLHGEAVAIGMFAAAKLAVRAGMFDQEGVDVIREIIRLYDLPVDMPDDLAVDDIMSAMEIDKKVKAGRLSFILPDSIGRVKIVEDVDRDLIKEVIGMISG